MALHSNEVVYQAPLPVHDPRAPMTPTQAAATKRHRQMLGIKAKLNRPPKSADKRSKIVGFPKKDSGPSAADRKFNSTVGEVARMYGVPADELVSRRKGVSKQARGHLCHLLSKRGFSLGSIQKRFGYRRVETVLGLIDVYAALSTRVVPNVEILANEVARLSQELETLKVELLHVCDLASPNDDVWGDNG